MDLKTKLELIVEEWYRRVDEEEDGDSAQTLAECANELAELLEEFDEV